MRPESACNWPVTRNRAEAPSGRPAVTTLSVACKAGSYDGMPRTSPKDGTLMNALSG
jgi:hypothetical protein